MNYARFIMLLAAILMAPVVFAQPTPAAQPPVTRVGPTGRPAFRYGVDAHFPPYSIMNPSTGEAEGFEVEMIRAIAETMGYDLSIHIGAWRDIKQNFIIGEIDVVGMWEGEERKSWAVFGNPFAAGESTLFVHKQGARYSSLDELVGVRVAIESGSLSEDVLRQRRPELHLQPYPTADQALLAVERREADVAICGRATGQVIARDKKLTNVIASGPVMYVSNICFCVRPGNEALLQKIDGALSTLQKSGRYDEIRDRWLGEAAAEKRVAAAEKRAVAVERRWVTVVVWIGGAAGLIAFIAIAALALNASLRRKIAHRTAELEREMQERRKAEDAAARAKRLESLGKITGRIAHDVNNVLTAVVGTAHLLRMNPNLGEQDRRLVQGLLSAADHGASMTRQLVAFSNGNLGRRQLVDLAAIVNALPRSTSLKLPPQTDLSVAVTGDTHLLLADYAQIEQLVRGLVRFAAGPSESTTCTLVEITLGAEAGRIVMRVIAHSRWLTDESGTDLFDPLQSDSVPGTLGLAACRAITQSLGGEISLGMHDTRGVVFTVRLTPATAAPVESETIAPVKAPAAEAIKVLLIEDNDSVRELVAMQLRASGYQVAEAENGRVGLEMGLANRPDILITDVVLPEVAGHELVKQLREHWPLLRVVVMSGYAEHADSVSSVLKPEDRILAKPFGLDELNQAVREVLTGISVADQVKGPSFQ